MEQVTVKIDRVFDLCVTSNARYGIHTVFGFESEGRRRFEVIIRGEQEIKAGVTVTAVLRKPGDWKTTVGWVEHSSGRIVGFEGAKSIWLTFFLCAVVWLICIPVIFNLDDHKRSVLDVFFVLLVVQLSMLCHRSWQDRIALKQIGQIDFGNPGPASVADEKVAGTRAKKCK